MHMADALLSPAVGGMMWAISAGLVGYSVHKIRQNFDESRIPLMGVTGAFVFAMQMINFAIPGTGSSGHIAGAVLLSALLGSCPAFLVMASVILIQALFFDPRLGILREGQLHRRGRGGKLGAAEAHAAQGQVLDESRHKQPVCRVRNF